MALLFAARTSPSGAGCMLFPCIWYGQHVGKLLLVGGVCGMRCLSWHALSTLHCVSIVIMEVLVG